MKKIVISIVLFSLLFSSVAFAQTHVISENSVVVGSNPNAEVLLNLQGGKSGSELQLQSLNADSSVTFTNNNIDAGRIRHSGVGNFMSFETAGSEHMRIDAQGRIGMGTTSPARSLDVRGIGQQQISVISTNADAGYHLASDNQGSWYIYSPDSSNALWFKSGSTDRMSLNQHGDLYVSGNVTASKVCDASGCLGDSSGPWQGAAGSIFYNGGNVGIGTASPNQNLHVRGDGVQRILVQSNNQQAGIAFTSDNTGQVVAYSPDSSNDMRFYLNGADRVTFKPTGRVGIGTNDPQQPLHIAGDGLQRIAVQSSNDQAGISLLSGNSGQWVMYSPKDTEDLRFHNSIAGDRVAFKRDGRVGIGTVEPARQLHVRGSGVNNRIRLEATGNANPAIEIGKDPNYSFIFQDVNSGDLYLRTDSASEDVILQAGGPNQGKVGVGTQKPIEKLHVGQGNVLVRHASDNAFPNVNIQTIANNGVSHLILSRARGNSATQPFAVGADDPIGILSFRTHNGQDFNNLGSADIRSYASELHTTTSRGGDLRFYTTRQGALGLTEQMRITDQGSVLIGTNIQNSVAKLHVNGNVRVDGSTRTENIQLFGNASIVSPGDISVQANNRVTVQAAELAVDGTVATAELKVTKIVPESPGQTICIGNCP